MKVYCIMQQKWQEEAYYELHSIFLNKPKAEIELARLMDIIFEEQVQYYKKHFDRKLSRYAFDKDVFNKGLYIIEEREVIE